MRENKMKFKEELGIIKNILYVVISLLGLILFILSGFWILEPTTQENVPVLPNYILIVWFFVGMILMSLGSKIRMPK